MTPHPFVTRIAELEPAIAYGMVRRVTPGRIEAGGPIATIGDLCRVDGRLAEVAAVDADTLVLVPVEDGEPVRIGARVEAVAQGGRIGVGDGYGGRAIDALGRPIDGGAAIRPTGHVPARGVPLPPLERIASDHVLETGIRAIDALLTLGRGQRIGVFAASGVGKTALLEQIVAQTPATRRILCLVGERGREVAGFWRSVSAWPDVDRATLVAATSDESAAMRARCVSTALCLAEHWRDRGEHVLLVVDSVTRLAMALREIGLAAGEPPTVRAYTVQGGETLAGIAAQLWGDSSLWYKLASANGLTADSALTTGQVLAVPAGVVRSTYNADSYRPYDPADMLGDLSPVTPTPAAKGNKCGAFGKILLVVVAVAVTIVSSGTALALSGAVGSVTQGITTVMSLSGAATVGTSTLIAAGVAGAMVGSAVSQGVGIATGMQDRFDWTGVAMAGLAAGVSGGLAAAGIGSGVAGAALRGALGNTITQGVAMATGLQKRFDWVGLAVAGVASGFGALAGQHIPISFGRFVNQLGSGLAGGIAGGLTRSVLTGTSFGDNVLAVLPDVIGSTVGSLIGSGIARISAGGTPFLERGRGAAATLSTSQEKYPNSSDVDEIVVTGRRPSTLDFSVNLAMAISGQPALTSFGSGPEVGIPIEHSNPVPKNAEDARHQLAKTLAQIDNFPASAQSKLNARSTVEAIYAPYLDPETYDQLASQPNSIAPEVSDVSNDIVSVGFAKIPISTFANSSNAPGAKYFSNVSSELGLYVESAPKTVINEAATLAGFALADIAGSLAAANPAVARGDVNLILTYKSGWSPAQRAEADMKVKTLTQSRTIVTQPIRSSTSAGNRYRSAGNNVSNNKDVDHMIDLQLGGSDVLSNMNPLDTSVNRSLGAQIQQKIKDLPPGTVINKFTIRDR